MTRQSLVFVFCGLLLALVVFIMRLTTEPKPPRGPGEPPTLNRTKEKE